MVRLLPAATLLAFMVSLLVELARTVPPAQPFQRIDSCMYKPQRWNDGDSFDVILPNQKVNHKNTPNFLDLRKTPTHAVRTTKAK
jgi:hypothetical protein